MKLKALSIKRAISLFGWPVKKPKSAEITLNYSCNAKCVFCYSSPELEEWKNKNSLSFSDIVKNLTSSYNSGSRMVQIIGGEPTIRDDLPEIIKAAKILKYPVIQMVTNGIRLSDFNYFKSLYESGLNSVTFSLHADKPEIHDKIVGIDGAYVKTKKAIENALKLGVYVTVGTAVNKLNYRRIPALVNFLLKNYSIDSCHIISLHYIGSGSVNVNKLKISYTAQLPYIKRALSFFEKYKIQPAVKFLSNYLPCILPGYEHIISDWEYPYKDDDLYLPEATYENKMYTMITNKLRMKAPSCKDCFYFKRCAGFEKEYFKYYGAKEFKPLKEKPKKVFSMDPYYL